MKKVLSFGGFCIVLIGLLAFSLQSTGKLTDSEERNALILATPQEMRRPQDTRGFLLSMRIMALGRQMIRMS